MDKNFSSEKGQEFLACLSPEGAKYKPKAAVRLSFPPGNGFKLLNMAEISAPGGVTVVLKLPFSMSESGLSKIAESVRSAGGTVEFIK